MRCLYKLILGLIVLILSVVSIGFAGDIDYPVPCSVELESTLIELSNW